MREITFVEIVIINLKDGLINNLTYCLKMKEVQYSTSSVGQIAYLMWKGVYPDDLTFAPHVACIYYSEQDFGDLIGKYWKGTTIPACELSECIVIAQRILDREEIDKKWFENMKEAIEEVREDYLGQLML